MPALNHVHTYERFREGWFRCIHPDCSSYARRELIVGKRALCMCGKDFILDPKILQLKKPHCPYCTKTRSNKIGPKQIAERLTEALT